jgi:NADPH:quinone reductase-like Zn-dependent oxidoreductase
MIRVTRSAVIDAPIERVWSVLRDFNSHDAWHPIIAESSIEHGEPSDQVGCVRTFTLKDGNTVREQLLSLSDQEHSFTYCILDSTVPLRRYVAAVKLKRVTDGERTFWHWQSTFDAPPGRERELAEMVAHGVYEDGFEGLRRHLLGGQAGTQRQARAEPVQRGQPLESFSIMVRSHGGSEVLAYERTEAPSPARDEVRLRQTAIGVNYLDVYVRNGLYGGLMPLPGVLGVEAAGQVLDVGAGVTHLMPGDRVAYACMPVGAYTTVRTMPAAQLVRLPDAIGDETAAGLMLKGMTAEYLLHRTHSVKAGDIVLVHAAAGGVGLLLCQWALHIGATVIGTVSSEAKARAARAAGCEHPLVATEYRFAEQVKGITGGRGADVIYDGLGQAAMSENVDALALCGHWISYGQASGALAAVPTDALSARSGTFSRPVLFHYTADRRTLESMAARVFDMVLNARLNVAVNHRYPLAGAAEAHRELEARRTTGSIIVLP